MNGRDAEATPIFRFMVEAIALAFLIVLAFVGPDVEEHNREQLRAYVNDR